MTANETRDQAGGGSCTWAIRIGTGEYVLDVSKQLLTGQGAIGDAHVWLDHDKATRVAGEQPWRGWHAQVVRARP